MIVLVKTQAGRGLAHTAVPAAVLLQMAGVHLLPLASADAAMRQVVVLRLEGAIDPAAARYVTAGVARAEREGHHLPGARRPAEDVLPVRRRLWRGTWRTSRVGPAPANVIPSRPL